MLQKFNKIQEPAMATQKGAVNSTSKADSLEGYLIIEIMKDLR